MKFTILLLAALFTTALVSCQSTGSASSDKTLAAVVNAGKAYLLASGQIKPADAVLERLITEAAKPGEDPEQL